MRLSQLVLSLFSESGRGDASRKTETARIDELFSGRTFSKN
jgi:hypothetical protein